MCKERIVETQIQIKLNLSFWRKAEFPEMGIKKKDVGGSGRMLRL